MEVNVAYDTAIMIWQVAFVLAAVLQLYYFLWVHGKLAWHKPAASESPLPAVSVVIAARNEYDNLSANLPLILDQDYPTFEVIVVNDRSLDDSASLLDTFKRSHPHLRVVHISENEQHDGGKKFALTMGLKAASHDRVVLTDADCKPSGKNWIRAMVASARAESDIVLGYSPYARKRGFLNAVIRFDSMHTAMNYLGFALAGNPYMGVGRNLSYSRSLFFEVGGYRKHYSLKSGDDDLFVNQVAHKANTSVCIRKEALMETTPETTWKAYWRQKRRHLTTGWKYRLSHRVLLLLQPLSLVVLLAASVALLLYGVWVIPVAAALALRVLIQMAIYKRTSKWLGQGDLVFFAPLLEIVTLVFNTGVHLSNASRKQTRWKT